MAPTLQAAARDRLAIILRSRREPVYALLDAARSSVILDLLAQSGNRYQSLYSGQTAEELASFAPYLVELDSRSPLLEDLIAQGWHDAWGYYVVSRYSFEQLRTHLRKFLVVTLEDQSKAYFRFYDPRVIQAFLESATAQQAGDFFSHISGLLCPDGETDSILTFRMDGLQLVAASVALNS